MTFSLLWATETELSVYHDRITELQQKFHESLENNQKLLQSVEELSQSVEDHSEQIRDLTLETKHSEMKSIQHKKTIEEILKRNSLKEKQKLIKKNMSSKIAQQCKK